MGNLECRQLCGGCGGCGSDKMLMRCVCPDPITDAPNYGCRVPVGTTPRPCAYAQGPKKSTPQLNKPQRQDLVDELQLRINHSVPDTPAGMSTNLSKYCFRPHVEASPGHRPLSLHNDGHVQRQCPCKTENSPSSVD